MTFEQLREDIESRAKQYSTNSDSHRCFIEEASGFSEGVTWALLKLYQLGYIRLEEDK